MASTTHDDGWYLFDYGMVISAAPAAGDWDRLNAAAGRQLDAADSTYWAHRHAFDEGSLDSPAYWGAVLQRDVPAGEAERLDHLDTALWSRPNPETAAVLEALRARGSRLALLSNMPVRMSEIFAADDAWAAPFEHLFFSGQLRLGKPDRRIYEHALDRLGAAPADVVFIDDKAENIDAAREIGMRTVHHTSGVDLAAELGL